MERLEAIVAQKTQETQDTLKLLTKLTGNLNEAIKEEQAMGISKGEMAMRQLVNEKVPCGEPDELASLLNNVVTEHTFQDWQVQPSVYATIKRDIILGLVKYARQHTEVDLNPDDYS